MRLNQRSCYWKFRRKRSVYESGAVLRRYSASSLVTDWAELPQCLVKVFCRVCEKMKLRVNIEKGKVMLLSGEVVHWKFGWMVRSCNLWDTSSSWLIASVRLCLQVDVEMKKSAGLSNFRAMKKMCNVNRVILDWKTEFPEWVVMT